MSNNNLNLNLDFQDYTPSNPGTSNTQQQPNFQVIKIPTSSDSNNKQSNQTNTSTASATAGSSVLNILQNFQSSQQSGSSQPGVSDDLLQQLIWATSQQKNRQQRISNSAGSWGMSYLSQYFDVTTSDVLQRIIWSAIPIRKTGIDLDELSVDADLSVPLTIDGSSGDNNNLFEQLASKKKPYSYMERFIQSRPDLYGPFWISTTLIFSIAIFSNLISFLNYRSKLYQTPMVGNNSMASNVTATTSLIEISLNKLEPDWHYTMDELNMSASVIIFYMTVIPTLLWFLFWFRGCAKYYTLIETICAYGYSLSIFIPLTALLMIQATIFRYLFVIISSSLSGLVLMMSFVPTIKSDPNAGSSHLILVMVPACQLGLAYILHRIMLQ